MVNYHELTAAKKTVVKPLVTELRKQLYDNEVELLKEGLTINFGKGAEKRYTVKIQIVA